MEPATARRRVNVRQQGVKAIATVAEELRPLGYVETSNESEADKQTVVRVAAAHQLEVPVLVMAVRDVFLASLVRSERREKLNNRSCQLSLSGVANEE